MKYVGLLFILVFFLWLALGPDIFKADSTTSSVGRLHSQEDSSVQKDRLTPALDESSKVSEPPLSPAHQQMAELSKEVTRLQEQLETLDQELRNVGYPEIMLDNRLSETEREALVEKVVTASRLFERISLLNLAKVDLKAGEQ